MSIAIIYNKKDPKTWFDEITKLLPEERVELYPDIKEYESVDFLVCWQAKKGDFAKFPNLKVIQSTGASVSHILDIYKVPNHVKIAKIVDHHLSNDMYEYVLTGIMMHMKDIPSYNLDKKTQTWKPKDYRRIKDTVISILGAGAMGMYSAKKLATLGFQVNIWSITPKNVDGIQSFTTEKGLEEMLSNSDFLISLLPLTSQTNGLIDYDFLKKLKKGSYFINAGRGQQVVDNDLIKCLDEGHLSGALLDVFHEEPLPEEHKFWTHDLITITPHVASVTDRPSAAKLIVENYLRMKNNQEILHTVSPKNEY